MNGTVETGIEFVEPLYPDGHQGNKAVNCAANAFVNGGKAA